MIQFLVRTFVRNAGETQLESVRLQIGRLGGFVGIVVNLLLFATKLTVGLLFGSIAVTGDAINNLSDAGSSIVSLISFRMSGKPADKDHPFGHARMEYIASSFIAFLILILGVELGKASISKILQPEAAAFSLITLGVLLFSILAKLWLYRFNNTLGKSIRSSVMQATATDSLSDVLATSAVFLSMILGQLFSLSLDGWMGAAVSVFILLAGLRILKDTVDRILGQGPSADTAKELDAIILAHDGVLGLHDLMVHDYGPNRTYASVHVEVDASADLLQSHELIDDIERDILRDMGIHLVIHLDPIVTDDPIVAKMRELVEVVLNDIDPVLRYHDFRMVMGQNHRNLIFDIVAPFRFRLTETEIGDQVQQALTKHDPRLFAVITLDHAPQEDAP